jgi:hypothetical protein
VLDYSGIFLAPFGSSHHLDTGSGSISASPGCTYPNTLAFCTGDPAGPNPADPGRVESAALDLLPTGIGIFGNDLTLVYSNRSFLELRMLPERLCAAGTRLEDIVRHLAARGDYGVGEVEALVVDRMTEILKLEPWNAEQDIDGRRKLPSATRRSLASVS